MVGFQIGLKGLIDMDNKKNVIKFSHKSYVKFPPEYNPSTLLQLFVVNAADLSKEFISYDTHYISKNGAFKQFPLPNGTLIVLLLQSKDMQLWTTIRRYTAWKYKYYMGKIGETFEIEITEEE